MFKITTKTIVATGIGAALFTLLGMFVRIPSPIPETSFQTSYALLAMFAAVFGPIAGALIAFIGHTLIDAILYGSPWWSWVISSGVVGFCLGLAYKRTSVEDGEFTKKDMITFNVIQVVANIVAWLVIAPLLDIVIYSEPVNLVFTQGAIAALMNSISIGVIGTILMILYAKTRTKKGSLE